MKSIIPYNPKDKKSILEHAKKLKGNTLNDFLALGEIDTSNKGGFGQILESGYFHLDNNSNPLPDFNEVGIELKATPMRKLKKGTLSPKERLVLGIINYVELAKQSFEESFLSKNQNLLIIFYLYEEEKNPMDYKILDVVEWEFPPGDLEIIKKDWEKIKRMVECGKAHEISGGMTFYLEAMPKGMGGGRDLRNQPYSTIPAMQRAFGLKSRYIRHIFESSKYHKLSRFSNDIESFLPITTSELKEKHIEDIIEGRLSPFVGMTINEILKRMGTTLKGGKDKYASLVRTMLGVKGRKIEEFEKAGITMRVVRSEYNGRLKESVSTPYIRYDEIINESWESSTLYEIISSRFLFVILQKTKCNTELVFRGIVFWSMPEKDLDTVHKVWIDTVYKIRNGDYDNFIPISAKMVSHVRPHGRDSKDLTPGPDGALYLKKCFWLNANYIVNSILSPFFKEL